MYNIIIIRAHGSTVKELYEQLGDKDKIIFQCAVGDKIPYWNNIDGALLFLKRAVSSIDKIKLYPYYYEKEIPKTLLSGLDKETFELCYTNFSKWLVGQKWLIDKEDIFLYPNEVAIKYHWFKREEVNLLHCSVIGSSDKHSLGRLIEILKKEFSFVDNIFLVPICRTIMDDLVDIIDTPTVESSGHFSYKTPIDKKILQEDILSAIERNNKNELNDVFFLFLNSSTYQEKEELKQKIINDYSGFLLPKIASETLDHIEANLYGEETEFYENFKFC